VQQVITRNALKFVRLQREDHYALNTEFRTKLAQQGMTFNEADTSSFRPRLAAYYTRWKDTVGSRAWGLLEAHVGKLA
jgi:TRAP-type transport system periplasmic protein